MNISIDYQSRTPIYEQIVKGVEKLVILNPFHVMKKGYSIVYKDNIIVSSITKIHQGDNIKIKMSDGDIDAIIK